MIRCEIPLRDALYRIVDTEGTDRDPHLSKVCEVAWIDVDADGRQQGAFETLVCPGIEIPPSASAVHHIVDADVAGMPELSVVRRMLEAPVYVAHGAQYDRTVLDLADAPWICTNRLAMHLWPELPEHGLQYLRYALGLKVPLPARAAAHTAMTDAKVCAALLTHALPLVAVKWPGLVTVGDLIAKIEAPAILHRIPFKTSRGALFEEASTDHLSWIVRTGAGGSDCIHTADHWLQKRGYEAYAEEHY